MNINNKKGLFGLLKLMLFVIFVLVVAGIIIYPNIVSRLTGNVVAGEYDCIDSDSGKDYNVRGKLRVGEIVKGEDTCVQDDRLKEYYCISKTSGNHQYYECANGCKDGRCISDEDIGLGDEIGGEGVYERNDENVQLSPDEKNQDGFFIKFLKWIFQ